MIFSLQNIIKHIIKYSEIIRKLFWMYYLLKS